MISMGLERLKSSVACVAYLDTIELFFRYPPKGLRTSIDAALGKRARIDDCCDREGNLWGYRIHVDQPNIAVLRALTELQQQHRGTVCRFDAAIDFPLYLAEMLKRCTVLKWRPPGHMYEAENGLYWVWQAGRKKRSGRDLLLYSDRASKITNELVAHLEMRFMRTDSVRRAGITWATDLIGLDPAALFERHIKLLDYDPERYKPKEIRAEVRRGIMDYRGKEISAFTDHYRASIPVRMRGLLERLGADYVQRVKDFDPEYVATLKIIPIDDLCLPNELSWKDSRKRIIEMTEEFHEKRSMCVFDM